MKNELLYLRNNYKDLLYPYGTSSLTTQELYQMLNSLQSFEHPDMYAKINNTVYILEHFEFDSSKESRKGMHGIASEKALTRKFDNLIRNNRTENISSFEKISYVGSFQDYQKNFEKHFTHHYGQIPNYKADLQKAGVLCKEDQVKIGFWIENLYPPLYDKNNRFQRELYYFDTKQFSEFLKKSTDVDFVLFSGYIDGKLQIVYFDKNSLPTLSEQIDLNDPTISWSKMNGQEVAGFLTSICDSYSRNI